jgi:hypothetical protein
MSTVLEPHHVQPRLWHDALAVARETCARFFRDGREPADALRAFGLPASDIGGWHHVVNALAELHHGPAALRRVA